MNAVRRRRPPATGPAPAGGGTVVDLVPRRIERALHDRRRWRYVHPRVEPAEGGGWQVTSPNCSRRIRADGGDVPVAWLQPAGGGAWHLHARDHAAGRWMRRLDAVPLAVALAALCADPDRVFWP